MIPLTHCPLCSSKLMSNIDDQVMWSIVCPSWTCKTAFRAWNDLDNSLCARFYQNNTEIEISCQFNYIRIRNGIHVVELKLRDIGLNDNFSNLKEKLKFILAFV